MDAIAWRRICCPVDFSAPAREAIRVAADVARRTGAELVLLFAGDGPNRTVQGQLALLQRLAEQAGAPRVSTAHAQGHPKSAIARWVNHHGMDLVVMGSHGWTGPAHAPLGSVAESTVRAARCPVMVVHGGWERLAGAEPTPEAQPARVPALVTT